MATINFRIKKTSKDPSTLYVRFRDKGADYEIPTGFTVYREAWSAKQQHIKRSQQTISYCNEFNANLRKFKVYIFEQFNLSQGRGESINRQWLEKILRSFFDRAASNDSVDKNTFFSDYVEWYIEDVKNRLNPRTGKKWNIRTIQDYTTTFNKIKGFEKLDKRKYKHTEIDRNFCNDFIKYCEYNHANNPKTIGGEIDNLRLFLRRAEADSIQVNSDYKFGYFVSPNNETHDIALSMEDIEKIQNCDLSNNDKLDNAKDWLIIGIWTGLRVSDLLRLNMSMIDKEKSFIEIQNKKTEIFVVIPIHKEIKKILEKRNDFPRKISSQKFNDYIKEVAKIAGLTEIIDGAKKVEKQVLGYGDKPKKEYRKEIGKYPKYELISSHICRRTFATIHHGEIETITLMNITGHKTEKQFLEYVKITPRQHAEKMKELWERSKKHK